jgi:hypothetical protein
MVVPPWMTTLNEILSPSILPSLMATGSPWAACTVPVSLAPSCFKVKDSWKPPWPPFIAPVQVPEKSAASAVAVVSAITSAVQA